MQFLLVAVAILVFYLRSFPSEPKNRPCSPELKSRLSAITPVFLMPRILLPRGLVHIRIFVTFG